MPVEQKIFDFLFLVAMLIAIAGVLWIPITWYLLSAFTPKKLLEKYFKEPYFSLTETILMAQFPGFLIRTGIFGWVILLPSLDKKRNIRGIIHDMPLWYRIALNILIVGAMVSGFLIFFLMGILFLIGSFL